MYLISWIQTPRILRSPSIFAMLENIMAQIDDLKAAVEAQGTVVASVVTLLGTLHKEMKDAQAASSDPSAFQPIIDKIAANTSTLATAVVTNTDAAPAPAPAPATAPAADPTPAATDGTPAA